MNEIEKVILEAFLVKITWWKRMPLLIKTSMSIMHPLGMSPSMYDKVAMVVRMILKGFKKAFNQSCHQLGKL